MVTMTYVLTQFIADKSTESHNYHASITAVELVPYQHNPLYIFQSRDALFSLCL